LDAVEEGKYIEENEEYKERKKERKKETFL